MAVQKLINIKEFCTYNNVGIEFILQLQQNEMIELVTVKRTKYIPSKKLRALEKMARLYNELNINIEGIHAIMQLLEAIEKKNAELEDLRKQLSFYLP